jgi:hypothetical protein
MRVLVTLSPRMYREAIALSIQRHRPGIEVMVASPEDAEVELARFRPHLLVHNDTAPIPEEVLEGVPTRVEMLYSDSMDARGMCSTHAIISFRHLLEHPLTGAPIRRMLTSKP